MSVDDGDGASSAAEITLQIERSWDVYGKNIYHCFDLVYLQPPYSNAVKIIDLKAIRYVYRLGGHRYRYNSCAAL